DAEAALAKIGIDARDRRAHDRRDDLGRLARAGEIARDDGADARTLAEALAERGGLHAPFVVERHVGVALPAAERVPVRLPVTGRIHDTARRRAARDIVHRLKP